MTGFRTNIKIMNNSDVVIFTWKHIIRQWQKINYEYIVDNNFKDSLYWYNERTNVGSLAGAIWKIGGYALEEYSAKKGQGNKYGRVDLFFSLNNIEYIIEAKQKWIHFTNKNDTFNYFKSNINKSLNNATKDCEQSLFNSETNNGLGLVFITPYWKKNLDKNKEIIKFEEELLKEDYDIIVIFSIDSTRKTDKLNLVSSSDNICNAVYMIGKYVQKK